MWPTDDDLWGSEQTILCRDDEQRLRSDVLRVGERVGELLTEAAASGDTALAVAHRRAARTLAAARAERAA